MVYVMSWSARMADGVRDVRWRARMVYVMSWLLSVDAPWLTWQERGTLSREVLRGLSAKRHTPWRNIASAHHHARRTWWSPCYRVSLSCSHHFHSSQFRFARRGTMSASATLATSTIGSVPLPAMQSTATRGGCRIVTHARVFGGVRQRRGSSGRPAARRCWQPRAAGKAEPHHRA